MSKAIVFLADGFEDCEGLAVVDLLRRASVEVVTASVMGKKHIRTAHGVTLMADMVAEDVDFESADLLVLPGGGEGTQNLAKSEIVKEQCEAFAKNRLLAAICAAPTVLAGYGLLEGKKAVCYPGMENQMAGSVMVDEPAVVDGNIITGRGPGAAFDFALELLRQLLGEEASETIRQQIVYRH